jgi:hypothetical protein
MLVVCGAAMPRVGRCGVGRYDAAGVEGVGCRESDWQRLSSAFSSVAALVLLMTMAMAPTAHRLWVRAR